MAIVAFVGYMISQGKIELPIPRRQQPRNYGPISGRDGDSDGDDDNDDPLARRRMLEMSSFSTKKSETSQFTAARVEKGSKS